MGGAIAAIRHSGFAVCKFVSATSRRSADTQASPAALRLLFEEGSPRCFKILQPPMLLTWTHSSRRSTSMLGVACITMFAARASN